MNGGAQCFLGLVEGKHFVKKNMALLFLFYFSHPPPLPSSGYNCHILQKKRGKIGTRTNEVNWWQKRRTEEVRIWTNVLRHEAHSLPVARCGRTMRERSRECGDVKDEMGDRTSCFISFPFFLPKIIWYLFIESRPNMGDKCFAIIGHSTLE